MARQFPIWVDIRSCLYSCKKSYGVKDHSDQNIKVGTSSRNSHDFGTIRLSRRNIDGEDVFQIAWVNRNGKHKVVDRVKVKDKQKLVAVR